MRRLRVRRSTTFEDGWEFVRGKFPDAHDEWEDIYVDEVEPGTWEDNYGKVT